MAVVPSPKSQVRVTGVDQTSLVAAETPTAVPAVAVEGTSIDDRTGGLTSSTSTTVRTGELACEVHVATVSPASLIVNRGTPKPSSVRVSAGSNPPSDGR